MIIVTGARGIVGKPLVTRLRAEGHNVLEVTRETPANSARQMQWDLAGPMTEYIKDRLAEAETIIHCAPIWLMPHHLGTIGKLPVKTLIAFSSTSVISKQGSIIPAEKDLVEKLEQAETDIRKFGSIDGKRAIILRPSLIYGYGRDMNISKIAAFIRKRKFMVLGGPATGNRQPVHADDLVDAIIKIMSKPELPSQTYALTGGETLTYKKMVERIFAGLEIPIRITHIPQPIYRNLLRLAGMLGKFHFTSGMADRMQKDLTYDISPAKKDFGYDPQKFLTQPERDLKI